MHTRLLRGSFFPLFNIKYPDLGPFLAPFWLTLGSFLHHFFWPLFCIDFWLIFGWFWYPWSCKKTILTLYSLQKTRNRRFWNRIEISTILASILASFWHPFPPKIHQKSIPKLRSKKRSQKIKKNEPLDAPGCLKAPVYFQKSRFWRFLGRKWVQNLVPRTPFFDH